MKKVKNKFFKLIFSTALISPIAFACGTEPTVEHTNFLVNYDNALDASLSLGISPDYYLSNFARYGKEYIVAPYLKDYIDDKETNIEDIKVYDGVETDRKSLLKLKPYAMLVNEWERVDEKEYDGIVSHMCYTSMGDTIERRWNKNDDTGIDGKYKADYSMTRFYKTQNSSGKTEALIALEKYSTYDWGVSPQKALELAANDIDKTYNTNGLFAQRAKEMNDKLEQRIKVWNEDSEFVKFLSNNQNSQSTTTTTNTTFETTDQSTNFNNNNVTIGIILGGQNNDSSQFKFLTPNAFPLLYSQLKGRGLGFNFPEPQDPAAFKNSTHYVETYVKAQDGSGAELLTQFKGKFDYLIYSESLDAISLNKEPNLEGFKTLLKTNNQDTNNRIYVSNYHELYSTIWGTMGYSYWLDKLLYEILPQFMGSNLNTLKQSDEKTKIKYPDIETNTIIRKETDFDLFPKWTY